MEERNGSTQSYQSKLVVPNHLFSQINQYPIHVLENGTGFKGQKNCFNTQS